MALRAFDGVDTLLLRGVNPVPVPVPVLAFPGDFEGVFDAFPAAAEGLDCGNRAWVSGRTVENDGDAAPGVLGALDALLLMAEAECGVELAEG